ncbi:MAG: hypothetical protein AABY64_07185 [Bdellovibrionota bacterium]
MIKTIKIVLFFSLTLFLFLLTSESTEAKSGGASIKGDSAISFGLSIISSQQKDLNSLVDFVNANSGGVSTKAMNSAYDFYGQYMFRFSGSMFGLAFRPSYFMQSSTGTGASVGDYKHELTGYTFFPLLRIYPLENNFIKFFLQAGVGYGYLKGKITQGSNALEYSGSNFGGQAGLGAEFCFTASQCIGIEGNVRYLPVSRNVVDTLAGTFPAGSSGLSQAEASRELEYDTNDLATTMSGIQGVVSYIFNF